MSLFTDPAMLSKLTSFLLCTIIVIHFLMSGLLVTLVKFHYDSKAALTKQKDCNLHDLSKADLQSEENEEKTSNQ